MRRERSQVQLGLEVRARYGPVAHELATLGLDEVIEVRWLVAFTAKSIAGQRRHASTSFSLNRKPKTPVPPDGSFHCVSLTDRMPCDNIDQPHGTIIYRKGRECWLSGVGGVVPPGERRACDAVRSEEVHVASSCPRQPPKGGKARPD